MSPLYYLDERGGGESFLGRGPVMLPHSCTIFIHLSFPFNLDKGHCHIPPFNTPLCSRVTPYQRSSTPLSPHFNTLLFVFCLPQTIGSPLFLPPIRTYILLMGTSHELVFTVLYFSSRKPFHIRKRYLNRN